ncbi:SMI1/KNR4 family protein [Streptomyces sasae]|uniref:SMI1/KNR4 family protein n=1 Tax=Streptomyces sasae TaxID=1266772 RepID=UPI00292D8098|nr:SMI1/KNR4 family protein [Streptomyces sasae]
MVSWDEDGVRARMLEMAAQDPGRERFGADTHRYELAPPLPEAEISAFEEAHGIDLPVEYRSFVARVGNGPAGPGHGLMPLVAPRQAAGEGWAMDDEWEHDRLPGRLAAPFPLAEPLPGRINTPADALTRGTLMVADQGCGMYVRLILNGPRAGEVWQIDPDWGGFVPASAGFRAWYTEWLQSPQIRSAPSGPSFLC